MGSYRSTLELLTLIRGVGMVLSLIVGGWLDLQLIHGGLGGIWPIFVWMLGPGLFAILYNFAIEGALLSRWATGIKTLRQVKAMSGKEFEIFMQQIYQKQGYRVR